MRRFFIFTLSLFAALGIYGQATGIGFKGGLSLTNNVTKNLLSSTTSSTNYKPSYTLGLTYSSEINTGVLWKTELSYSNKGYKNGSRANGNLTRYDYHYVTLPFLVDYYVLDNLFIEGGAYVGLLTSAKFVWNYKNSNTATFDPTGSVSITESFHRPDLGIIIGFGYQFNDKLQFSVRYNMGLINISDPYYDDPTATGITQRVMNRSTDLTFCYQL
jgi:hypothetical protein